MEIKIKKNIKTSVLKKYLEDNKRRAKEIGRSEAEVIYTCILQWVQMETEGHNCIECGEIIKAGNHNILCSGSCEVAYA